MVQFGTSLQDYWKNHSFDCIICRHLNHVQTQAPPLSRLDLTPTKQKHNRLPASRKEFILLHTHSTMKESCFWLIWANVSKPCLLDCILRVDDLIFRQYYGPEQRLKTSFGHKKEKKKKKERNRGNARTGTWTLDPQIKSLMLYRLSYPGSRKPKFSDGLVRVSSLDYFQLWSVWKVSPAHGTSYTQAKSSRQRPLPHSLTCCHHNRHQVWNNLTSLWRARLWKGPQDALKSQQFGYKRVRFSYGTEVFCLLP